MHGETSLPITHTPKYEREPSQQSSENEEKTLLWGGQMVNCEPVASGVRWPKSNWEIPVKIIDTETGEITGSVLVLQQNGGDTRKMIKKAIEALHAKVYGFRS